MTLQKRKLFHMDFFKKLRRDKKTPVRPDVNPLSPNSSYESLQVVTRADAKTISSSEAMAGPSLRSSNSARGSRSSSRSTSFYVTDRALDTLPDCTIEVNLMSDGTSSSEREVTHQVILV